MGILDRDVLHHAFLPLLAAPIARLEYRREHAHLFRSGVVVKLDHPVFHTKNELTRTEVLQRVFRTLTAESANVAKRGADIRRHILRFQLTGAKRVERKAAARQAEGRVVLLAVAKDDVKNTLNFFRLGAGFCGDDASDHSHRHVEWNMPQAVYVPPRLQVLGKGQGLGAGTRTAC